MPTPASSSTALPSEARAFVERDLGRWSSHPAFARRRAKWLLRLPLLLISLLVGLFLWKGLTFELRWLFDAIQARSWLVLLAVLILVGLVAFAATATLVIRASVSGAFRAGAAQGRVPIQAYVLMLAAALLAGLIFFYLPQLIPPGLADAAKVRRYSLVAALLPYVLTLTLLDLFAPPRGPDGQPMGSRKFRWLFLSAIVGGAAIGTFIMSLKPAWAEWLVRALPIERIPFLGPWIAGLSGPLLQAALRVTALISLLPTFWLLGEWTLSGIPEWGEAKPKDQTSTPPAAGSDAGAPVAATDPPDSTAQPAESPLPAKPPPKGVLGKLRRLLSGSDDAAAAAGPSYPPWIQALLDAPEKPAGWEHLEPAPAEAKKHTADLDRSGCYNHVFGGIRPSADQVKVLDHFLKTHAAALAPSAAAGRTPCADFLIEGENGSGKTTTLLACAVLAIVVRGERVVLFVPDATTAEALALRVAQFLRSNDLHWFLRAEVLSLETMSQWVIEEAQLPEIILTTPRAWEETFFGTLNGHPKRCAVIRRWLTHFTTLLVDDVASRVWSPEQLTHLPCLIDKQRLLLAAESRFLQVVAATTPLPHQATREVLFHRLSGRFLPPISRTLRPWLARLPLRLEVQTRDEDTALFSAVEYCLKAGQDVLIYREGIGLDVRQELLTRLLQQVDAQSPSTTQRPLADRIRIVAHLMEPIEEMNESRVILYSGGLHDPLVLSLSSRFNTPNTVLIGIQHPARSRRLTATDDDSALLPGFPILVSREAPALLITHLRSLALHLAVGSPIPRDALSVFGFQATGNIPPAGTVAPQRVPDDLGLRFALDPADHEAEARASEAGGIWPMACFSPPSGAGTLKPKAVATGEMPEGDLLDYGLRYWLGAGADTIEFGRIPDPDAPQRRGYWLDGNRKAIGITDLARLEELRVQTPATWFWCRLVQLDHQDRYQLVGDLWRGNRTEAFRPILTLQLTPSVSTARAEDSLVVLGPEASGPPKAHWVRLCRPINPSADATQRTSPAGLETLAPAYQVHAQILGAVDESGHPSRYGQTIACSYPAAVSALLLDVPIPEENIQAFLTPLLARAWNTQDTTGETPFWPELTLALQTGLLEFAPRLLAFCRVAAFRLTPTPGGAVLLFIEPLVTAGTIEQTVRVLLHHGGLLDRAVLTPARQSLSARQYSGPTFQNDTELAPTLAETLLGTVGIPEGGLRLAPRHPASAPPSLAPAGAKDSVPPNGPSRKD